MSQHSPETRRPTMDLLHEPPIENIIKDYPHDNAVPGHDPRLLLVVDKLLLELVTPRSEQSSLKLSTLLAAVR